MSVDTHKFGQGHKGTSVVLYRSAELRQQQYTRITDWTGGLYISPGLAGSRPGGLIATAWAALVAAGREGYLAQTRAIMEATHAFRAAVGQMADLEVLGAPESSVIAFRSRSKAVDIYKLNDLMTGRGWHLNALQHPAALHFCFTAAHVAVVPDLVKDLQECCAALRANPGAVKGGSAPIYGMANVSPDRAVLGEFLVTYQDVMLTA